VITADQPTFTEQRDSSPAVEVRDLRFAYPDGRPALAGLDLVIAPGEKVALVGPNGAGKSTLLLHLNGLLRGTGSVKVLGQEISQAKDQALQAVRAQVGLVFQDPDDQLFSATIYEDVAFGPRYMGLPQDEVDARVREALAAVNMVDYATRMSHHLSGGEKKRAALATVLSMRPQILCLDEPSANLDPRARRELIRLLDALPLTVLVTTHDMHMVKEIFPRMVIMDGGRVVADGATWDLLDNDELLEAHGLEGP
jgi:cobalt transport protein ATP-binding subunit